MENLLKKKFDILIFILLIISIFFLYKQLFNFSFEAEEWVFTARYLPLTKLSLFNGLAASVSSPLLNIEDLSGGQHIIPIASIIYYLNTKLFGINYFPYAFMSLLLHSLNSILIFLFIKLLLDKKRNYIKNIFGILGAIFFAFAPSSIHTITGAAPFYGQNILSVTFFLLCIFSFKLSFLKKERNFIYLTIIFLFLSLFTKETSFFLFLLLPVMALIEKRIFPLKFLGKVFAMSLVAYLIVRFVIPNFYALPGKISDIITDKYIPKSYTQPAKVVDTGTIVSRDLSIYKNLPGEVLLRTVTFPIRMTGTLFLPRTTVFSIVQFITPIMVPLASLGDTSSQLAFSYGPGNFVIIYLASLIIIFFCLSSIVRFIRQKQIEEAQALATGLAIILFSALPLVAIIFSFPRWGYDFYFDARFYYNPNVGAAIVFPFLILGIARFFSKLLNVRSVSVAAVIVFLIWLVNNMSVFSLTLNQFINRFGADRREIINQVKSYMPVLPEKTVFFFETDGLSAFGPSLPFYTSVPQAFAVSYYDKSPLPDDFLIKPLFNAKPEGYLYKNGRGLGYYTSKKNLSQALLQKKFEISDIYAFYYKSLEGKLFDTTLQTRKEMQDYLDNADILSWKKFSNSSLKISFLYPQSTEIEDLNMTNANTIMSLFFRDPQFNAEMFFINVSSSFNINENIKFQSVNDISLTPQDIIEKDVFYDKYRFNKLIIVNKDNPRYFLRFGDMIIYVKTISNNTEGLRILERILGSLEIINEN